jgi:hypothetical protein
MQIPHPRRAAILAASVMLGTATAVAVASPASAGTNGQHAAPCGWPLPADMWANISGFNQNGVPVTVKNIWVSSGQCTKGPLVTKYWWLGDAYVTIKFRFANNGQPVSTYGCYIPKRQSGDYVDCYNGPAPRP